MISFPTAAIRQFARDSGLSDGFLAQYQSELESFALRVASAQLRKDQQKIRHWYFDNRVNKQQIFEVLGE